ncbi:MAG: hypothetical protein PHV34_08035 [Verrucomicrobiae bacterium]|nr:hypothetical protein [Verrucomicrobiae bacterium]
MSGSQRHFFSFYRLWTIAANTMTEIVRQKFFYILLLFGVIVLILSLFLLEFSHLDRVKFIKDFNLAAIAFFGALITIVGTAELLPLELENRTIYPILAKPVFRLEFLLGKFTGMISLLLLTLLLMSVIFAALLFYTETQLLADAMAGRGLAEGVTVDEAVRQVKAQVRDAQLFKAILLIYFKLVIVCAVGILIATFATSVVFNVICTSIIYICGHLVTTARAEWMSNQTVSSKPMLGILVFFIPDLDAFNIADALVLGQSVSWELVFQTIRYGFFYTGVILLVAHFIFDSKEI